LPVPVAGLYPLKRVRKMIDHTVREFGAIRLVTTDWPIVLIEFPEKRIVDADLRSVLGHF
jgi:hypothetical protein